MIEPCARVQGRGRISIREGRGGGIVLYMHVPDALVHAHNTCTRIQKRIAGAGRGPGYANVLFLVVLVFRWTLKSIE